MSDLNTNQKDKARYIVGIDLGTTNCALSYIDTLDSSAKVKVFKVMQWDQDGALKEESTLPSFLYFPPKSEWKKGQKILPLHKSEEPIDYIIGKQAREQSYTTPDRVILSAKSWLCHDGINRESGILPWNSDDILGDNRLSPVEVQKRILTHLRDAWDHVMAPHEDSYKLSNQEIAITVPASFDEVAQRLTLQAAKEAGYPSNVRLLEEPTAAFYNWLSLHTKEDGSHSFVDIFSELNDRVYTLLVCDIGGGTTDFCLLEVDATSGDTAFPKIRRRAVSDHILLGGDNIDLTIAYEVESQLSGSKKLGSRSFAQLVSAARNLKEKAFSKDFSDEDKYHISIVGESGNLFASTLSAEVAIKPLKDKIVNGFFPECTSSVKPEQRESGLLKDWGLPYAHDCAVSHHLAAFLRERKVDAVLYTGGTLKPQFLQSRITEIISSWQGFSPTVLNNDDMDLAVSYGAAYFGFSVRMGKKRVRGGYARSLYAEVVNAEDGGSSLITLLPKGYDCEKPIKIDSLELKARVDQPVRFQLFTSNTREDDKPGEILSLEGMEGFHSLPIMQTILDYEKGKKKKKKGGGQLIDISLEVKLLDTGIVELYCLQKETEKEWLLNFNLRDDSSQFAKVKRNKDTSKDKPALVSKKRVSEAYRKIELVYGKKVDNLDNSVSPLNLARLLEESFGKERQDWDMPLLRSLWEPLKDGLTRKNRSMGHESSWLYLAGYALRPGYGDPLDNFRMLDLWKAYNLGLSFKTEARVLNQWWIMWRRVAGGLDKDKQEQIFAKIYPSVRNQSASPEMIMLAGSLERVDMNKKVQLGNKLVEQIRTSRNYLDQKVWALARVASRVPLYSGPDAVVRPKFIGNWFDALKKVNIKDGRYRKLNVFYSQAGRVIQDRELDISEELREKFIERMSESGAHDKEIEVVKKYTEIDRDAQNQLFGEALPSGLVLM